MNNIANMNWFAVQYGLLLWPIGCADRLRHMIDMAGMTREAADARRHDDAEPGDDLAESDALNAAREARWIKEAIDGSGLAYRRLVEPHLGMLHRLAMRAAGNEAIAQDAVQESLVLAYKRLHKLRADSSMRAFLAGLVIKRAKTLLRSERRARKRDEQFADPRRSEGADEHLEAQQLAQRLREQLSRMPAKRAQVVMLRLDAGLSYEEIAQSLSMTPESARVLVHLGLKDIKGAMARNEHDDGEMP